MTDDLNAIKDTISEIVRRYNFADIFSTREEAVLINEEAIMNEFFDDPLFQQNPKQYITDRLRPSDDEEDYRIASGKSVSLLLCFTDFLTFKMRIHNCEGDKAHKTSNPFKWEVEWIEFKNDIARN